MNKKIKTTIITVLLMLFCLCLFTACQQKTVGFLQYSASEMGAVGKLVRWMHDWLGTGNYGWTVVLFTVILKVVMLPMDFWQRFAMRKSAVKMQAMQPLLDDIDKRYGANSQRSNEEKQKLYKKQGYSMLGTCLPTIISMVVFFVMFGGLNDYSTYSSVTNYKKLAIVYQDTRIEALQGEEYVSLKAEYDVIYAANISKFTGDKEFVDFKSKQEIWEMFVQKATDSSRTDRAANVKAFAEIRQKAMAAVKASYSADHESWLWIQNVWQPDTWSTIMSDYDKFSASVGMTDLNPELNKALYNDVRSAVLETGTRGSSGNWNGLMILPILSIGLSFLSLWISQRMERKNRNGQTAPVNDQQAASNKMMMILMPLMMAVFGFMYTGAFAIYMVVNYSLSILSTIALRAPVEKAVQKSLEKATQKGEGPQKANYER